MVIRMLEFAMLGGFLMCWIVSSIIIEDEIENKQNHREIERQHQTSDDESEENWSD